MPNNRRKQSKSTAVVVYNGKASRSGQNRNRQRRVPKRNMRPRLLPGLFRSIGSGVGGRLGGPLGSRIGGRAGDMIASITGFGAYKVNGNSISEGTVPTFLQSGNGVEISHREYLMDINGSTGFVLGSYPINPALSTSFPWLSSLAVNFEQYEFRGLVYEFRPSSGSAISSTSSALGVVVFATDYNVLGPTFPNKQSMESYEFSSSCVPFNSMIHPVECAPRSNAINNYFTRDSAVPAGSDARLYDVGLFQYATQGMQSVYTVGELWVSYHIMLKKPRITPTVSAYYAHITSSPVSTAATGSTLGTAGGVLTSNSNLQGVTPYVVNPTNSFLLSSIGNYLVVANLKAPSGDATSSPSFTFGTNIVVIPLMNSNTESINYGIYSPAARGLCEITVSVTAAGSTGANAMTLVASGYSLGFTDIHVTQLPALVN